MFLKKVFPKLVLAAAAAAAVVVPQSTALAAAWHYDKYVVHVIAEGHQCVVFELEGVPDANPPFSGSPRFEIPKNHPNFGEMFAILLSAKTSRRPVTVHADGNTCGVNATTVTSIRIV